MLSSSLVGLATVLCLFGLAIANPTTEAIYQSLEPSNGDATTAAPAAEQTPAPASQTKSNGPCSSSPYEPEPCGMTAHQGFFSWVTDTRKYEWIYMAFCLTLGSCIFVFVISAAIYNARYYKRKEAARLKAIRDEDEKARLATGQSERRGSHLAHPRRDSLSVAIQDPASSKR